MGMIYKRTYKRKEGTTGEAAFWWIKYYRDGQPMFESTGTTKEKKARDLLKLREGDITRGVPVTPKTNRVTFKELTDDVLTNYRVNGKRSVQDAERRVHKHLLPFFGDCKAAAGLHAPGGARAGHHLPVGLPSQREADPFLSPHLEDGLQEGRVSGHDPARLPADCGACNGAPGDR